MHFSNHHNWTNYYFEEKRRFQVSEEKTINMSYNFYFSNQGMLFVSSDQIKIVLERFYRAYFKSCNYLSLLDLEVKSYAFQSGRKLASSSAGYYSIFPKYGNMKNEIDSF